MYNGIAATSKAGPDALHVVDGRNLLSLITAAYAVITGHAYEFSFEGWIEAEGAEFDDSIIGFRAPRSPSGESETPPRRSRQSVDMRRAAFLAGAIFREPGWRLAVRDVHAALLERGDEGFVYAYRAIEDIARALTGRTDQLTAGDWAALHQHLRTSEDKFRKRIASLQDARRAAAHGDETDQKLVAARERRGNIVEVGRLVVAEALARSAFPLEMGHISR